MNPRHGTRAQNKRLKGGRGNLIVPRGSGGESLGTTTLMGSHRNSDQNGPR